MKDWIILVFALDRASVAGPREVWTSVPIECTCCRFREREDWSFVTAGKLCGVREWVSHVSRRVSERFIASTSLVYDHERLEVVGGGLESFCSLLGSSGVAQGTRQELPHVVARDLGVGCGSTSSRAHGERSSAPVAGQSRPHGVTPVEFAVHSCSQRWHDDSRTAV